jgi:diguanylate cyclase (GGDEF)-like protein/PAS domain S-box-containing protein
MTEDLIPPETYRLLVEESLVGVYLIQDERLVYANRKFAQLFGYSRNEMMAFPSIFDVISDEDRAMVREKIRQRLTGEIGTIEYTVRAVRKNQTQMVMDIRSVRTTHDGRPAVLGTVVDITARKQLEDALRALALIDELTGLYNRRGFMTLAERQLTLVRRKHQCLVLVAADLDGLKEINDRYGHQEGDRAIIAAAGVLRQTYREADIVARLGGDEFTVFPIEAAASSVPLLIDRLHGNIRAWNERYRAPFTLSMSTGSAVIEGELTKGLLQLLAEADAQLYKQKRERAKAIASGALPVPFWGADKG